jgi:DNA-binding transcriptional LysR family regulator
LATGQRTVHIELKPRLVTSDLRVRLQAAVHGIGIALLPEQVISRPLKERLVERVLPECPERRIFSIWFIRRRAGCYRR